MTKELERTYTLEEEVAGLTVISDALKKQLDHKREQLATKLRESGHGSTGTALGEIRRSVDKVQITDTEAWTNYASEHFGVKPVKQYTINDMASAIQVLLEHAPGLVDSVSAPAPAELAKLESKLHIAGDTIVGADGRQVEFAKPKFGNITVASSPRKKAAVEAALAMIDDAVAPLGMRAIED